MVPRGGGHRGVFRTSGRSGLVAVGGKAAWPGTCHSTARQAAREETPGKCSLWPRHFLGAACPRVYFAFNPGHVTPCVSWDLRDTPTVRTWVSAMAVLSPAAPVTLIPSPHPSIQRGRHFLTGRGMLGAVSQVLLAEPCPDFGPGQRPSLECPPARRRPVRWRGLLSCGPEKESQLTAVRSDTHGARWGSTCRFRVKVCGSGARGWDV